jgi:type I restriction enzyme S subunit
MNKALTIEKKRIPKSEEPYKIPENWVWVRLDSIILLKSGQDLKPSQYTDTKNYNTPYITGASCFDNNVSTPHFMN